MSGIGIDEFTDDELVLLENAYGTSSHGQEIKRLVAEIRRLRAENKELRASYERVEKYGQILLIETGELKDELSLWKRNADR